jgi:hypothetical protein
LEQLRKKTREEYVAMEDRLNSQRKLELKTQKDEYERIIDDLKRNAASSSEQIQ